jgi:hypothetical protein
MYQNHRTSTQMNSLYSYVYMHPTKSVVAFTCCPSPNLGKLTICANVWYRHGTCIILPHQHRSPHLPPTTPFPTLQPQSERLIIIIWKYSIRSAKLYPQEEHRRTICTTNVSTLSFFQIQTALYAMRAYSYMMIAPCRAGHWHFCVCH